MSEERASYDAGGGLTELRSCEIVLGEKRYTVREASYLRARQFWPILSGQLSPLGETLKKTGGLGPESELREFADLVPMVQDLLQQAPVAVLDAICVYDAKLAADRKQIEDTASDRQLMMALLAMMEMSDPFGVRKIVRRGLSLLAPSSSSPAPNGE